MDTVKTMKFFRSIAPVGNPISLQQKPLQHDLVCGEDAYFYQSGTAALAAAMSAAKLGKETSQAEVILPAYACPDLVSAAVYAGLKPVLVDLEAETPFFELTQLKAAITDNTCAIVAINFLGISERLADIKQLISSQEHPIALIEDRAQSFPANDDEFAQTAELADLSIYSFGKGKPVSLLGGGLVKVHNKKLAAYLPARQGVSDSFSALKALAYNIVIHPLVFWLLELLPIGMGKTVYKPLDQLQSLSNQSKDYLQANIEAYRQREQTLDLPPLNQPGLVNLNDLNAKPRRLLRLPLLAPNQSSRDQLLQQSKQRGLGYSALYQTSLPKVEGVPSCVAEQGPFPNAENFAQRLVTLPTHAYARPLKPELRPMRVLQICSGDLWGGAEAQFLTLNQQLNADPELDVRCITFNHGDLTQRLEESGIAVRVIDESQLNMAQMLLAVRAQIQDFKPDTIHTHGAKENTLGALANVLSRRVHSVRTTHGAPEFVLNWRQVHKQLFGFADWICGKFLQHKIIAVSEELAGKLSHNYPSSKIVVAENGIDVAGIQAKAQQLKPSFKDNGAINIGIVGRLVAVKRVDLFIETAALVKAKLEQKVCFHIIGDGPLRSELENQVKQSKLEEDVVFHGHQANCPAYLDALDILLMCSDHEGLPMTALEAMAVDTPIVSCNIGALKPRLAVREAGILSDEHTAIGYANSICDLIADNTIIKTNGLSVLNQGYTAEVNKSKILKHYYSA